jgi:heme-degrading monooxygenase HmoA
VDAITKTPEPPYTAVIFTSLRRPEDAGYARMMERMVALVAEQPGYLGHDAFRDGARGINVSFWVDADAARGWKRVAEHTIAQDRGRQVWYDDYVVRIATVERDYEMHGRRDDS